MEEALASDDLIRKLCSQIDRSLYTDNEDIQPSFGMLQVIYLWSLGLLHSGMVQYLHVKNSIKMFKE